MDNDEVVVVAARFAYPEYLKQSAYVCQPERAFRGGLTHMGFYAESAIQTHLARIRHREDKIMFTREEAAVRKARSETDRAIAEVIEANIAHATRETREEGSLHQVFLLSAPDDPETVRLAQPIRNDTVTESGRVWAWTMGQRYVSLASLTRPGVKVTKDLAS